MQNVMWRMGRTPGRIRHRTRARRGLRVDPPDELHLPQEEVARLRANGVIA